MTRSCRLQLTTTATIGHRRIAAAARKTARRTMMNTNPTTPAMVTVNGQSVERWSYAHGIALAQKTFETYTNQGRKGFDRAYKITGGTLYILHQSPLTKRFDYVPFRSAACLK